MPPTSPHSGQETEKLVRLPTHLGQKPRGGRLKSIVSAAIRAACTAPALASRGACGSARTVGGSARRGVCFISRRTSVSLLPSRTVTCVSDGSGRFGVGAGG